MQRTLEKKSARKKKIRLVIKKMRAKGEMLSKKPIVHLYLTRKKLAFQRSFAR